MNIYLNFARRRRNVQDCVGKRSVRELDDHERPRTGGRGVYGQLHCTIVPPNEAVAILGQQLSLERILLRLLHGNIQIAVETAENAPVFQAGIQAHANRSAQEGL
jgi:hypothetical protein